MQDLAILTCRYFGSAFFLWALAFAILCSIQPISVLTSRGFASARSRRGARRTLFVVGGSSIVVALLGAALVGVSFYA